MEQKSREGILAEVSAMAQGYDDIADLLNKLRGVSIHTAITVTYLLDIMPVQRI